MQQGQHCEIIAIASREPGKASSAATTLNIPKAYDTYEALLNDPEVEAVYIPLPNHLHVEYAEKALASGKHVLCEKPISLWAEQAKQLADLAAKYPKLKLMEAFMYRFHPLWHKVKQLLNEGTIGEVRTIQAFFSYFNDDPNNIRNIKEAGGGALMDIGCYCISQSRYLIDAEPIRVIGLVTYDKNTHTDRQSSAMLDFGHVTSTFTCSTQLNPFQRFHIFGTKGSIEIEIPVNIPHDVPSRIFVHKSGLTSEEIIFDAVNQYTLQGDAFSLAILEDKALPVSIEDAVNNMKVIEAVVESGKTSRWVNVI